jgi:calcineurin-like phosphoesterase family protein
MSVFFISDLHLGHKNMAIKRGFEDEEQMNNHIIKSWNSVVTKRDHVFILGDVTMEKVLYYPILSLLNGTKTVVLGNHDEPQHVPKLLNYVNKVAGMIDYKKEFILTHCPIHPSQLEFRYSYNIHGHVHENSLNDNRYINVSAEVINYIPVEFNKLIKNEQSETTC